MISEEYLLGIDEAGRGPVLGPMVYGTSWCPVAKKEVLAKMGFADSKQLTDKQREKLFDDIKTSKILGWAVDSIQPEVISGKMLRRNKTNLNAISHNSAIGLIQLALDQGVNVQEVYVDTVGTASFYQEKLKSLFPNIRTIVVCKKADSIYPIVSAASICAKVTRDSELENWAFRETAEKGSEFSRAFGCGYPGDEKVRDWLDEETHPLFGWPSLVRFSWKPCKDRLKSNGVQVEWGDSDDEDEDMGDSDGKMTSKQKSQKLTQFFAVADANSVTSQQHAIPIASRFYYFGQQHMNLASF